MFSSKAHANASADKIKIHSTSGKQLHMFEVQVFSSGGNVASLGTATQSSTFRNLSTFAASNAIDGDSTTFSKTNDFNPSWELVFEEMIDIERIVIHNRWCLSKADTPGCLCRLSNATVTLYKMDAAVETRSLSNTCGELVVTETYAYNSVSSDDTDSSLPINESSKGTFTRSIAESMAVRFLDTIPTLSSKDFGNVGVVGSSSIDSDTGALTVTGSGQDIWGRSDQFHFLFTKITGGENFMIELFVEDLTSNLHEWVKGGIMIRDTLSGNSMHYSLFATGSNGLANQYRACTGCYSRHNGSPDFPDRNVWLRITKIGYVFRSYYKHDDINWTQLGKSVPIPFSSSNSFFVGVAVTSHVNSRIAELRGSDLKTYYPTDDPTPYPTPFPTNLPTYIPTYLPTEHPTPYPTEYPTEYPTYIPTYHPTPFPTPFPTNVPTYIPTYLPTEHPTPFPTPYPTEYPTDISTEHPTPNPTPFPTKLPAHTPSRKPRRAKSQGIFK
jgi:hypothetical protein